MPTNQPDKWEFLLPRVGATFDRRPRRFLYNPRLPLTSASTSISITLYVHSRPLFRYINLLLSVTMSKLSPALKALINSPAARPSTVPAPAHIASVYQAIQQTATAQRLSHHSWLALSVGIFPPNIFDIICSLCFLQTAATMTMNSPDSLAALYRLAAISSNPVQTAELIREVGLKCISFNGIPRTINCLNAFKAGLPDSVSSNLSNTPTRTPNAANIAAITDRGVSLWDSIYRPFERKLYDKLADAHPDLPVHILNSHYGALLSDPARSSGAFAGRLLTSIVAVSCLRAQSGVGPQVTSHVFGLRKALEDGSWKTDVETEDGARWLASDEGNGWILNSVDSIVEAIGSGRGSNFAPGRL